MDKRSDLALALVILVLGAAYYYMTDQLPAGRVQDPLGPAWIPRMLAMLVILSSLWIVAKRLWQWNRTAGWMIEPEGESDDPSFPASLRRVLFMLALAIAYIAALPQLGFLIATPIALGAGLAILGLRRWRHLLGQPLAFTLVLYLFFDMFLGVGLPMGLLEVLRG